MILCHEDFGVNCYRNRMHSVRLLVTACAVYAYYLLQHAQCTLTICNHMSSVRLKLVPLYAQYCIRLQSTKYLAFFNVHGAYANNLLPYAQCTLIICYRIRSVR